MQNNPSNKGLIFNIQHYSVHDGNGIRVVVFFKGCPLKCAWCSNPESQSSQKELGYNSSKCIGCCRCIKYTTSGVMTHNSDGILEFHPEKTTERDLKLSDICPSKALICYGQEKTCDEILSIVENDSIFFARSGGGITLSGGEPLMQGNFVVSLLREARARYINTAIETCGVAKTDVCLSACEYLDELFFDIKLMDSKRHQEVTGLDNEIILNNIRSIRKAFPKLDITIRTPVIPNINDSDDAIAAIARFIRNEVPGAKHELLAYHRFGMPKYAYLKRKYPLEAKDLKAGDIVRLQKLDATILAGQMS